MAVPGFGTFNEPFMDVPPFTLDENNFPSQQYFSDVTGCKAQNKGKYYFSKIAVIAEDQDVQDKASTFFTEYVFPLINMTDFSVDTFDNQDDAFNEVKTENEQPYCFGVYFEKFDV